MAAVKGRPYLGALRSFDLRRVLQYLVRDSVKRRISVTVTLAEVRQI